MMPVQYTMTRFLLKVPEEAAVLEAARMMRNYRVGSLLVTRERDCVGIITERDMARRVLAEGLSPSTTTVGDVMSSPLITVESGKTVRDASALMREYWIRHLGVTQDGRLVGVVTLGDLMYPPYGMVSEAEAHAGQH